MKLHVHYRMIRNPDLSCTHSYLKAWTPVSNPKYIQFFHFSCLLGLFEIPYAQQVQYKYTAI